MARIIAVFLFVIALWGTFAVLAGAPSGDYVICAPESTVVVEFGFDDGSSDGYLSDLAPGDAEAMRFCADHPCSIFTIWFYTSGTGDMEVHVWGDMSGMPDFSLNCIDPFIFHCSGTGWKEMELEEPLVLEGLEVFHIGYFKFDAPAPYLHYSNNPIAEPRSHLYDVSENAWYYIGSGESYYPYMIRANGKYFNILTEFEFSEVSEHSGISGGSVIAWGDYDNDGDDDLLAGGILFRNDGDHFTNVTGSAGISGGGNCTWGDYDNDGFLDFYMCAGVNADKLYRNIGGTTFQDVTISAGGLQDTFPTAAAGWGDADNDGYLDLYVANAENWYDTYYVHYPDIFYHNNGDGTFSRATHEVGMGGVDDPPLYGRGVSWCDFDWDGDQDVYVSNYRLCPNYLWVNDGEGSFNDEAAIRGVRGINISGYYGHTIGSSWGDINNDGYFDLFVSNLAHPRFIDFSDKSMMYLNQGPPFYNFEDIREYAGITYYETHSSCAFGDYNNDCFLDLFISCVYEGYYSFLYRNNGDLSFTNVNYTSGVYCDNGWGCAWSDYDNDGDLDLAVRGNGSLLLYRNNGNRRNWIKFKLEGAESNRSAFGAIIKIVTSEAVQIQQVEGGTGTCGCQNSIVQHFGLNELVMVDTVFFYWPSGIVDTAYALPANDIYLVTEGDEVVSGIDREKSRQEPISGFLMNCYPNPFNAIVKIELNIPAKSTLKVAVYDLKGRLIEKLYDGIAEKGKALISWDTREYRGDKPASGLYLVKSVINDYTELKTNIILLK
ncbi:VCBS repeat-containing protein [bacterium]|nr:VCBS repeat-containing protein [bacterium]